jgi:serine protease Do
MLVAMCCLSMGIAIGALLRGVVGAGSSDNKLVISNSNPAPDALSAAFARAARLVEPSVVNIKVTQGEGHGITASVGTGSGIIVDPAGFILTNQHVISDASKIKVQLPAGGEYDARVTGQDEDTDLAVLKIAAAKPLPAARMGDSGKLNVGDWVLAIGSPFGWDQTVTAGIISAKDRVTDKLFQQFLQTDAAINPGNSGGPLVNLAGEVIGINTQIETRTGLYNGIGFALPSSTAVEIYNQLIAQGRVTRGFLGVKLQDVTPQVARKNGVPDDSGAVVEDVTSKDSPAARSGIQSGDVIVAVNGQKVKNKADLVRQVASLPVGSSAVISFVRDGHQLTASVRLNERGDQKSRDQVIPSENQSPEHSSLDQPDDSERSTGPRQHRDGDRGQFAPGPPPLGLSVETLKPDRADQIGLAGARGVLIKKVEPGSIGSDAGLQSDDVITLIDSKSVRTRTIKTVDDYLRAIQQLKHGDEVVIRVIRGDGTGAVGRIKSAIATFTVP